MKTEIIENAVMYGATTAFMIITFLYIVGFIG